MSGVRAGHMSPTKGTPQLYDARSRRNGLGDIFEDVDMAGLMERLELKTAGKVPCSLRLGEDTALCRHSSHDHLTASSGAAPGGVLLCHRCDQPTDLDEQCVREDEVKHCYHSCLEHMRSTELSATDDDLSHNYKNCGTSSLNSSADFQQVTTSGNSSSSSRAIHGGSIMMSESGKCDIDSAVMEVVDNRHVVLTLRPEVCAKRSLLF